VALDHGAYPEKFGRWRGFLKDRLGDQRGGSEWEPIKFFSREIETSTRRTTSVEPPKSHAPHFYLPFAKTT
jgi:hypothetical protein